ncbi:hypothetical protein A3Q56_04876 [Intoshia linei]|uniref:Neurotransmitter-gated ion-channel ligand-binding domain-containing protein n=1 Tax=Intoshia linei TaxID=1819745 RepID=A0A177B0Y5_9BILA|nr:hypothetical protein A3Q56_04876 [Intoshia linei]
MKIYIFFLIWQFVASRNREEELIKVLLKDHNSEIRPLKDPDRNVTVKFGMTLIEIIQLNEIQQHISMNAWFSMSWKNDYMIWNKDTWNITNLNMPISNFWIPDIYLYNNAESNQLGTKIYHRSNAVVHFDGTIMWVPTSIVKATCKMNLENFPFDTQMCELKFGSWTYSSNQLDLQISDSLAIMHNYVDNRYWDISDKINNFSIVLFIMYLLSSCMMLNAINNGKLQIAFPNRYRHLFFCVLAKRLKYFNELNHIEMHLNMFMKSGKMHNEKLEKCEDVTDDLLCKIDDQITFTTIRNGSTKVKKLSNIQISCNICSNSIMSSKNIFDFYNFCYNKNTKGAGQEVGRSCIIVSFKGKKIMLDCGIHPGQSGGASLPYIDSIDVEDIDMVLISQ